MRTVALLVCIGLFAALLGGCGGMDTGALAGGDGTGLHDAEADLAQAPGAQPAAPVESSAKATTLRVPADFKLIQSAVDAAASGATIIVSPGTYQESIDLKSKTLNLQSTNPVSLSIAQATVIQGTLTKPVIKAYKVSGGTISGLTLRNGKDGIDSYRSALTARNCIITANAYSGLYAHDLSTVSVIGSQIKGNRRGVYCLNSSPTVSGNTIELNAAQGIFANGSSRPSVAGNTIRNNAGPGIECAIATISGNTILGNAADNGGGIKCSGNPSITNNLIAGNQATYRGGGLYCTENPMVVNNTIVGNFTRSECGGNIWLNSASPVITNCIIAFATGGGGIAGSGSPRLSYCDVYGNIGGDYLRITASLPGNISKDPLFVNRAAGSYRLKSKGGHWNGSAWVKDTATSPCLDAGDPASVCSREPVPNGRRINMGYDGNTATTSKSL